MKTRFAVPLLLVLFSCSHGKLSEFGGSPPKGTEWIVDLPGLPADATPLVLVHIPAGSFLMGSPESEEGRDPDEGPVHRVTLTKDFYIGKYEVTQAQWMTLMDENRSTEIDPNYPVNKVSWFDCQEFLRRLNELHNTNGFRLPTEAEREYACRAGTTTATYFGENPSDEEKGEHAWYRHNITWDELHKVGLKKPNPWGLHDMHGNLSEWCQDWFGPYPSTPQLDPIGPPQGLGRVIRGASWMARPRWIRSADRGRFPPDNRRNTVGFRIVWSK